MEPFDDDPAAFGAPNEGEPLRRTPPPPPDQRPWRHPSEVAASTRSPLDTAGTGRTPARRDAVLAAGAGLLGAVAAGALLVLLVPGSSDGPRLVAPLATITPARSVSTTTTAPPTTQVAAVPDVTVPLLANVTGSGVTPWPTLNHSGATAVPLGTEDLLITTELGAGDGSDTVAVTWGDSSELLATVIARGGGFAVLQVDRRLDGVKRVEWSEVPPTPGSWVTVWSTDRHRGVVVAREGGLALAGVGDDHALEGAPVLDQSGRLVGLCSRDRGTTALIPVSDVRAAIEARREPPWLGIAVTTADTAGASTVVVTEVMPGGPAALAGVRVDDVVVSFASVPVDTAVHLAQRIEAHRPGDVVAIAVRRGDTMVSLQVTLGGRPFAL